MLRNEASFNLQIIQLKKQRSSHIRQLTKTINKVSDLIDREKSFEELVKCNDLLEISIKAIRDITTKIIRHETDDKITEKEINIGTEQEFRLIQIRKLVDSYCSNVEKVSSFKTPHLNIPCYHLTQVKKYQIQAQSQHPFLTKLPATVLVSTNVCHYLPFARELTHTLIRRMVILGLYITLS